MNSDIAIKVENLTKIYKLYDAPIDRMKEALHWRSKKYHKDFYALNDVSFEIKKGETIGIIGKNGSGKSTLLKIITGVLSPSAGHVTVKGKISALLELGTGFNPQYTGMENIYFQGNLMGYTKEEIDASLQSILDFADIGDFIHQPVKIYSSGMYARLAFACAINVNPDILIVDEVLAVGDARFARKCFAKMEEIKKNGATIIFVTHDISMVKSACDSAVLINEGKKISAGLPKDVTIDYFKIIFPQDEIAQEPAMTSDLTAKPKPPLLKEFHSVDITRVSNMFGLGGAEVLGMHVDGFKSGMECTGGEDIEVVVRYKWDYEFIKDILQKEQIPENIITGVSISDVKGTFLFGMATYDKQVLIDPSRQSTIEIRYKFTMPYLCNGAYLMNTAIALGSQETHVQLKWLDGVFLFKMHSSKKYMYGLFYQDYMVEVSGNE